MHYARAMKITAEDLLLDRTVERYVIILKLFEINFTAMPFNRQFDLIHSKTIINSESKKTRFFIRYYERRRSHTTTSNYKIWANSGWDLANRN